LGQGENTSHEEDRREGNSLEAFEEIPQKSLSLTGGKGEILSQLVVR